METCNTADLLQKAFDSHCEDPCRVCNVKEVYGVEAHRPHCYLTWERIAVCDFGKALLRLLFEAKGWLDPTKGD